MFSDLKLAAYAGVALVMAGLTTGLFYYRASAASSSADLRIVSANLTKAEAVNRDNLATMARIAAARKADDELLTGVSMSLSEIMRQNDATQSKLADLGRSNAEVRDYLSTRIPADLSRVLTTSGRPRSIRKGSPASTP